MLVSAKLLVKGQQSLHAAPHVIAGSAASSYSGRMARALLHPRTTLVRSMSWVRHETLKRSFSTNHDHNRMDQHGPASGAKDQPLYRMCCLPFTSSLLTLHAGKLIQAWSQTPTKWYPLPLAVGALLLVAIQYRHKFQRGQKEVHVNDEGAEIIKLKGPWQVRVPNSSFMPTPAHHRHAGPRLRRSAIAQSVTPMGLYELPRAAHLVPTLRVPLLLTGIWL